MIVYRVSLDENFDADLITRIDTRANGASPNEAIKFLLRYWFENENRQDLCKSYLENDHSVTNSLQNGQDNEPTWSDLDQEF